MPPKVLAVLAAEIVVASQPIPAHQPTGLAIGPGGLVAVSDIATHSVYLRKGNKPWRRIAGTGLPGGSGDGGPAAAAALNGPHAVAFSADGTLWICDSYNHSVRQIDAAGNIRTAVQGLNNPQDLRWGADGYLYIADSFNHALKRWSEKGGLEIVAGATPPGYGGDGGPAKSALLSIPFCFALDGKTILICDSGNSKLRRIGLDGVISHFAGSGPAQEVFGAGYEGDGGPAVAAKLFTPAGVCVRPNGEVVISDTGNNVLRAVSADGKIRTLATGFLAPQKVVCEADGRIFVADKGNGRIVVLPASGEPANLPGLP
jgi:hypothetical protein